MLTIVLIEYLLYPFTSPIVGEIAIHNKYYGRKFQYVNSFSYNPKEWSNTPMLDCYRTTFRSAFKEASGRDINNAFLINHSNPNVSFYSRMPGTYWGVYPMNYTDNQNIELHNRLRSFLLNKRIAPQDNIVYNSAHNGICLMELHSRKFLVIIEAIKYPYFLEDFNAFMRYLDIVAMNNDYPSNNTGLIPAKLEVKRYHFRSRDECKLVVANFSCEELKVMGEIASIKKNH